ncbi:MAG: hypothetical protein RL375_850 [Pseudomonadota bacterium]|jgi:hypothetical protein
MNARRPRPVTRRRRQLDVRLLIASGAIEAELVPSRWRALLAWLLGPSPWRSPWSSTALASTQFAESTQHGVLP